MRHYPIFLNMDTARVLVSGGGAAAIAKLRLILKTPARVEVFALFPAAEILTWEREGHLTLHRREMLAEDAPGASLIYAADEDAARDAAIAAMARAAGVLVNIVDNLEDSAFITPAIVDRDPVCVAIGTEGAAPVLARSIKADLEERLAPSLGLLTRAAQGFRKAAEALPMGGARRAFWAEYFTRTGPQTFAAEGEVGLGLALSNLLDRHLTHGSGPGRITLAWTGSDDPELLTLKTRKALDRADVVIHDAGVASAVLELARREAHFVSLAQPTEVPPLPQILTGKAAKGLDVLYLSTAPLPDSLIAGCEGAGPELTIIPGLPGPAPRQALKETA